MLFGGRVNINLRECFDLEEKNIADCDSIISGCKTCSSGTSCEDCGHQNYLHRDPSTGLLQCRGKTWEIEKYLKNKKKLEPGLPGGS